MKTTRNALFLIPFLLLISFEACSSKGARKEEIILESISYDDEMIVEQRDFIDEDVTKSLSLNESSSPISRSQSAPSTIDFVTTKAASHENDGAKRFIRRANLNVVVKDIIKATHAIEDIVIAKKGFIINSTVDSRDWYAQETRVSKDSILVKKHYQLSGNLQLRVHYTELDQLLREIAPLFETIKHRDVSAQEMTFDLLEKQLAQERKREKSSRVEKISGPNKGYRLGDLLTAEELIDRAKEQGDIAKVQELRLEDQIEYSTITITLEQDVMVHEYMQKVEVPPKAYRSNFFWKALNAMSYGWDGLLIAITGLITIWPLLLLIAGIVFGISYYRKKKKEKKRNMV